MCEPNTDGSFLVRKSGKWYHLSILHEKSVRHYPIFLTGDNKNVMFFITYRAQFHSISDLIAFYTEHPEDLCASPLKPYSLSKRKWFFEHITTRVDAEMQLLTPSNQNGSFLVRKSETISGDFTLSLRFEEKIWHYRIRILDDNRYYIKETAIFASLEELISHYSRRQDMLPTRLRFPCFATTKASLPDELAHSDVEIDPEQVSIYHEMGKGTFAKVYMGHWKKTKNVAVKEFQPGVLLTNEFVKKAGLMKKLHHVHLVEMYGIVCTKEGAIQVVMELMKHGSLLSILKGIPEEQRLSKLSCLTPSQCSSSFFRHMKGILEEQSLASSQLVTNSMYTPFSPKTSPSQLVSMCTQVARGMTYLEEHNYIHGDLSARNILVDNNYVCKVADFGLVQFIDKTMYKAHVDNKVRWMSPEAALDNEFTLKSDVWSFGIVMYEVVTQGKTPYDEMTNAQVLESLKEGHCMPQFFIEGNLWSLKLYDTMKDCWRENPTSRPTFKTLKYELEDIFTDEKDCFAGVYSLKF